MLCGARSLNLIGMRSSSAVTGARATVHFNRRDNNSRYRRWQWIVYWIPTREVTSIDIHIMRPFHPGLSGYFHIRRSIGGSHYGAVCDSAARLNVSREIKRRFSWRRRRLNQNDPCNQRWWRLYIDLRFTYITLISVMYQIILRALRRFLKS